jgi:glycosyltransferase involved in cell wall biosynthesis
MFEEAPVKVAFLIPSLEKGGAESVMVALANHFSKKQNLKIFIITVYSKQNAFINQLDKSIEVICLGFSKTILSFLSLGNFLKKEKIDHLLFTPLFLAPSVYLAKSLFRLKVKVYARISESMIKNHKQAYFQQSWLNKLSSKAYLELVKNFSYIICPVPQIEQQINILNYKINNSVIIENPFDSEMINQLAIKEIPSEHESIFRNNKVIITACRIHPVKNLKLLIDSFNMILSTEISPKIKLLILGDGPQFNDIQKYINSNANIRDHVYLLGYTSNVYSYVARSSVFVLSSYYEGSPNALIEACIIGTPVVSVDCQTGPKDILESGKYGSLLSSYSPGEMSLAIKDSLISGKRHKKHFNSKYSIHNVGEKYFELMKI